MNKKLVWGIIVLLIAAGVGFFFYKKTTGSSSKQVKTVEVIKGDLNITLSGNGNAAPQNRVEIKPPIGGRIETIVVQEGSTVRKGQILAWMSSTERAALLDSARNQGPREMAKWEDLYKPIPIVAPVNGTLILRNVNPGQTIGTSEAAFVLSDQLIIKVQVDESDIAKIKLGQQADVVLDAHPDSPFTGRVDKIAFEAITVNNVTIYQVDILPDKPQDFLRSGMSCSVTFQLLTKKDVLLAPTVAIISKRGKSFIKKGKDLVPVKVGLSDGKSTEIISGATEGERIALPQFKRSSGQQSSNPFAPARQNNNNRRQQQ
jgi:macrolide-specific efflux system membrane fusion protein